jgi:hypothetical protein
MNNYLLVLTNYADIHAGPNNYEQMWFTVCAYTEEGADAMGDNIAMHIHENDTDKQWTSIVVGEV